MPLQSYNPTIRRAIDVAAIIILIVLIIASAVIVHRADEFELPIPVALKAAVIISPSLQFFVLLSSWSFSKTSERLSQFLSFSVFVTGAIDVALISAGTTWLYQDVLLCILSSTWKEWFHQKSSGQIRQIQDTLSCCGLVSVRDMAWPFPDRTHGANACASAYGRDRSCLNAWSQEASRVLSGIVGIGAIGFVFKVILLLLAWRLGFIVLRFSSPDLQARQHDSYQSEETRRLLTDVSEEEEEEESSLTTNIERAERIRGGV